MKVSVAVTFQAENIVQVEVPDNLVGDGLRDAVQESLEKSLPEVMEGASFMFAISGCVNGDEEEFELGKNDG